MVQGRSLSGLRTAQMWVIRSPVTANANTVTVTPSCLHIKDALHAGESQQRLNLVAVWREAKVFTEAERAALELAEQGRGTGERPSGHR